MRKSSSTLPMEANAHSRLVVPCSRSSHFLEMAASEMMLKSFGWSTFTVANAHAVIDRCRSSNAPKSRVMIAEAILLKRSVWLCSPIFA